MTPKRFVEALDCIHWTPSQVSHLLGCSNELVEAWASGKEEVPRQIGAWLEALAEAHEAVGVPKNFRGRELQRS
jgi:hypothetical protein